MQASSGKEGTTEASPRGSVAPNVADKNSDSWSLSGPLTSGVVAAEGDTWIIPESTWIRGMRASIGTVK